MDSWDFETNLDVIEYRPQKNSFIDIWHYDSIEPNIQEGVLDSENLDQYLSEASDFVKQANFKGGLRLIYSSVDDDTDCGDDMACWSQPDFIKIIASFKLPKRFTQMVARCHCIFAHFPPDMSFPENDRYGYIFSTMFNHYPLWYLAASWDPKNNITYAFLHCKRPPDHANSIPRFKRFLTQMAIRPTHPMLLPVLVIDLETNLTLQDDEYWTEEIRKIESETRGGSRTTDPLDLDLHSIVQRLNGGSIFLSKIERESEAVLLQLEQMHSKILDMQSHSLCLKELTPSLIRQIDFLVNSRKNLLLRLQNLQRRSQIQLAFTYNFVAQRDNKLNIELARDSKVIALASSRDSTAMKTVAILTIAFLPATFVSSLFAMPLFDWKADSKGDIVGPYFWTYCAFAIPLTILVLGSWIVWIRALSNRHKREDDEVRARGLFGLISHNRVAKTHEA